MTAIQTKTPLLILGLQMSFAILQHGSWGQDGSATIIITPVTGAANTFELIRVHPEEVEVGREGIRLSFSRSQVARARNPEAESVLAEAAATLERVERENLEEFPDLLERMERDLPRVQSIVQRFDWLIPQASATLAEVEQTVFDIRNTLLASERLAAAVEQIERMAEGAVPLAEDWEESITKAMAEAQLIPYLSIREEVVVRISKAKRAIRLDLASKTGRTFTRIKALGADLLDQMEKETLSEERWSLGMSEMKRLRDSIPEPDAREEIDGYIRQIESETEGHVRGLQTRRMFVSAQEAVGAVEEEVESGTIAPASGEEVPQIEKLRDLLAGLPKSATKGDLEDRFANIEHRLERALETLHDSATPEAVTAPVVSETSLPKSRTVVQEAWFIPAAVGGGIGILILVFVLLRIRKRKVRATPGTLPGGDIFTSSPDAWQKVQKERDVEDVTGSPLTASPAQEDVFGFKADEPADGEPIPVRDPFSDESTAETSLPTMEDPFALDETSDARIEDFLAGTDEPAEVEDPFAPTAEEDFFGFGAGTTTGGGLSEAEPAELDGVDVFSIVERPEDDPLGLTVGPVTEDETTGDAASGPETEGGEATRESREEDLFGFDDFLSSSEENDSGPSSNDDDIFGFSEERK